MQDKIGSLVKTSLVDYPNKVATTLFLHGCNLRCPYCYNKELVTGTVQDYDAVTLDDVKAHLQKRKNILTGFVISGGEPLLNAQLDELIIFAKNLGYSIKVDTNGTMPAKLERLLNTKELCPDYVALDVKTSIKKYATLGNCNTDDILRSIKLVSNLASQNREFRTVLVRDLVTADDIDAIARLLPQDASWYFAPFKNQNCLDVNYCNIMPYTQQEMQNLVDIAQKYITNAKLR